MAEIWQTICDNDKCGAVKKAENHWWALWVDDEGELHLRPMRGKPGEGVMTFCGEPCAMKKISEFMSPVKGQRKGIQQQAGTAIGSTKGIDLLPEDERCAELALTRTQ